MSVKAISITLPENLLAEIDSVRGDVPRSTFLSKTIIPKGLRK